MSSRGVRIVVGEGPSTRKGLLRFVLDGEGYDVVAEASTTPELARLMSTHRPDVVVLDDGIDATAVGMINEMSPDTRVILVWPGAVMPIGGAARVEPSRVLQDLGRTVERLTGQPSATGMGKGAALLDRANNDPDVLRAMLAGETVALEEPIIEDREPSPVVILPLTPTVEHDDLVLNVPEAEPDDEREGAGRAAGVASAMAGAAVVAGATPAAAAEAGGAGAAAAAGAATAVRAGSALTRRLGNLALGGAAVASALVLALALGGTRVPISGIRGQAPAPTTQAPTNPTETPPPGEPGDGNGTGQQGGTDVPGGEPGGLTPLGDGSVVDETPGPVGPPGVGIDPVPIGPEDPDAPNPPGNGSTGGGGDHTGSDSGDHDRGGGNDRDGDDPNNGGGNDGDGPDADNGGGNDDPDNPGHGDADGSGPAGAGASNGDDGNGHAGDNGNGNAGGEGESNGNAGGNGNGNAGGNGNGNADSTAEATVTGD